ncbi:hypothetical protein ES705_15228 [subsurface metagenome]
MPIKDFQGRGRIPRLGKIKLGIKKKKAKSEYPSAVDYFVCPIEVRAVYGEKPKKLQIAFHADELEEVFPQYYKRYGKSTGLVCKGDGEIANAINTETGEFGEIECLGRNCDYWKDNKCKTIGNLYFMIRGVNRFGVYQLDTSSYNSILNINGGIEYAKKITGGRLALVPFILEVIPQEVNPEGKKKTVYVLRLEADISKMMKALDSKPQDILSLDPPVRPEGKDIEEDLHKESVVTSIKPVKSQLKEMYIKANKIGYDGDMWKVYLQKQYGVKESSEELTTEQFEEIMKNLNEGNMDKIDGVLGLKV